MHEHISKVLPFEDAWHEMYVIVLYRSFRHRLTSTAKILIVSKELRNKNIDIRKVSKFFGSQFCRECFVDARNCHDMLERPCVGIFVVKYLPML